MIILATPDQPKPGLGFSAVVFTLDRPLAPAARAFVKDEASEVANTNGVTIAIVEPGIKVEFRK